MGINYSKVPFVWGIFLLCLPIVNSWELNWIGYVRLVFIGIGLGYLLWRQIDNRLPKRWYGFMVALTFIFILSQFNSVTPEISSFSRILKYLLLILTIFVLGGWAIIFRIKLGSFDRLIFFLIIGIALLKIGSYSWQSNIVATSILEVAAYMSIWIVFFTFDDDTNNYKKKLLCGIVGVFTIVFLVGTVRGGTMMYHFWIAENAFRKSEQNLAMAHYIQAERSAKKLQIESIANISRFTKGSILAKMDRFQEAAQALDLENGFISKIGFDEWEGPEKGNLNTNIKCWKELEWFPGKIEIRIFAKGTPASGIWPRMSVMYGGRLLGEIDVTSSDLKPYIFETETMSGRGSLEVAFKNDSYQPPEDRNLWVESAEIQYLSLYWR